MILVSIIMPVYNSEKYVEHAVNCLLEQTEKNIEVILVDDGSTMRLGKYVIELQKEIQELKLFIKKMLGFVRREMLD